MMTPFEQSEKLYRQRPDMDFQQDLRAHFSKGYVISTPQAFAMARAVRRDWSTGRVGNPWDVEPLETADCWFIWLLCGSLKEAVKYLPYSLPWFGFAQRDEPARFIEAEKALAKIG